jgi:muramoyltetrapeptide carboxypeptidase LdcA involved in peptidoglycan recycling
VFDKGEELLDFDYRFYRGESMKGVVVGGNIRCLLKLAGTEYFPDVQDKILFLESLGGQVPKMVTYLNQLKQMGVFEKVSGIMLGTFSEMEENICKPDIVKLVMDITSNNLPVAKTQYIGHGADSKAIVIGKEYIFRSK